MADPNKPDSVAKAKEVDADRQAAGAEQQEVGETTATEQENANRLQEDISSGRVHGDTTSSNGEQNAPGYHGRDGGVAAGTENNPAATEEAEDDTAEAGGEESGGALPTL
jgi:hypothetical protein